MFEDKIRELARLRVDFDYHRVAYQQAILNVENSDVGYDYKGTKMELEKLETEIRQEAEANFKATGEKNPHPAVEVKQVINLIVDEGKGLEYAKTSLPDALGLNRKIFDKVMKALPEEKLPDGVKIEQVPKVYIDKDLSGYLENN